MPSPFPGMDPFLEHPDHFPGLHDRLIYNLSAALTRLLPRPDYYADIASREWVEVSRRYVEPDVEILHRKQPRGKKRGSGGTAVAPRRRTKPVVIEVPYEEHREQFIRIYARRDNRVQVVTVLEILSLANKTPGEKGQQLYAEKQREVLNSTTNLVEIDLLRRGDHTTAVPLERLRASAGAFDYHACIHPYYEFGKYYVYPVAMEEPLPVLSVPLLGGDRAVALDLQEAMNRSYDDGPYDRSVAYADQALTPAPSPERLGWVAQLLRAQGIERTGS